jgi:hypothetical protein
MKGKSTVHEIEIERTDMPNIFVEAVTIADGKVHSEMREIVVPPEQRIANVEVIPSAESLSSGRRSDVKLKLTDLNGNPFVGNTVLSVYDASLEYIAASSIPEIRSFFWNVRRQHHASIFSSLQRASAASRIEITKSRCRCCLGMTLRWVEAADILEAMGGGFRGRHMMPEA